MHLSRCNPDSRSDLDFNFPHHRFPPSRCRSCLVSCLLSLVCPDKPNNPSPPRSTFRPDAMLPGDERTGDEKNSTGSNEKTRQGKKKGCQGSRFYRDDGGCGRGCRGVKLGRDVVCCGYLRGVSCLCK
ncbi:hypothetical protein DL98DRAFT_97056 [Cadophora sp. DSE1049]|nr:hypothetical protein DL98DRAFT_97056 [Cadophora sp. DSE1049]